MTTNDQLYRMRLDDPATPGFCSVSKSYYGTLDDFCRIVDNMDQLGHCQDTVQAFQSFLEGNTEVEHTVCYNKEKLLTPVEMIAKIVFEIDDVYWEHINIYDCVYQMRADKARVEQVLLRDGDTYYRCIRPLFSGLLYQAEGNPTWRAVGDRIWGHQSVVKITDDIHEFLVFVCENNSKDLKIMVDEMWSIDSINYATACDEIFGNG